MARMGHKSEQAAMRYLHATENADAAMASGIDAAMREARDGTASSANPSHEDVGAMLDSPRAANGRNPSQYACDQPDCVGAGDENRTRVLSLGS